MDDRDRLYDLRVMEPGSWPNTAAPVLALSEQVSQPIESWLSGEDPNCGIVIEGGTAPEREAVGVELARRMRDLVDPPVDAFIWSEMDFADNYRNLRSLEDFAKKERDPEIWNNYVNYERKFYRLMSREVLYFQGLGENKTIFDYQREFLHAEITRRLTQTQYESPRLTIISTPQVGSYEKTHRHFFEYLMAYTTVVNLETV